MAPTIHATVPFSMLMDDEVTRLLVRHRIGPEIYLPGELLDTLTPKAAEAAAGRLRDAGLDSVTVHAPFEELWPGSRDEEARGLCLKRWKQALEAAAPFRPRGIVLHGGYFDWLFDFNPDRWLEPATRTFSEIAEAAEKAGTDLFVENVFDEIPDHLLRLREAVGSPRLFFCCDPGHANLFSKVPVHRWIEAFGPWLREIHVHDNRGQRDDHLPVGEGTINYKGVLLAARDAGADPILTLEAHNRAHVLRAVAAIGKLLPEIG